MPNTNHFNDSDHGPNDDFYRINLKDKRKHFLTEKLVANNKQQIDSGCFIGPNTTKSSNGKFETEYDSTGQKQTDDSSQDDDELLENNKPNHTKTDPVNIKTTNRLRGILKYPPGWPKRAFSDTDALIFEHSLSDYYGYFDSSLESPEILLDCFAYDENIGEDCDPNKPKKSVTFSDKKATYVFRPNSSILGRRNKNQKKAKKKKERELKKSSPLEEYSEKEEDDFSPSGKRINDEIEAVKKAIELQRSLPYDDNSYSSTDVSSSSGCDTSASECSSADENTDLVEDVLLNAYEKEQNRFDTSKSKRKNRRRRNRKNKLNMKTFLEIGGFDSD